MASQTEVDVIIKAISQGFDQVSKDIAKIGTTTGEATQAVAKGGESAGMAFTELASKMQLAQQAGQVFFGTFQKAFELGEQGAQVRQTAESFDTLLETIGAAPDLLNQMSAASRGTIDDMSMMSSVSTLLAGTSDELGQAMAAAAPQLVEIAKAASKLNPSLGDTTFMFESLGKGIKRSSPMILDNLGIVVKTGEVYDEFAASIGKTAEQLTSEEKQMALLNGVLSTGATLIEQVGGSTDAATDSFERMNAALANAGNAIKAQLADPMASAAEAIYILLSATDQINGALSANSQTVAAGAGSWSAYATEMERAFQAAGYMVEETDGQLKVMQSQGGIIKDVTAQFSLFSEATFAARDAVGAFSEGNMQYGMVVEDSTGAITDSTYALEEWSYAADQAAAESERLAREMDMLNIMSAGLEAGLSGDLLDAMTDYQQTIADLNVEHSDLNAQLEEAILRYGENSEQVAELNQALQDNVTASQEAAAGLAQATAEMIYQQASAGLSTEAALELARSMGLLSEQDYAVAASLESLRQLYDQNRDGAITAAEGASQFAAQVDLMYRAISNLQQSNAPITMENIANEMSNIVDAEASAEIDETAQAMDDAANASDALAAVGGEVAQSGDAMAGAMANSAGSLSDVSTQALSAESGLGKVKSALEQLSKSKVDIDITSTGGSDVVKLIDDIKDGIASLPSSKTVSITVNASSGTGGGDNGGSPGPDSGYAPIVSNSSPTTGVLSQTTYNIYNPLALEVAQERERTAERLRLEGIMQ